MSSGGAAAFSSVGDCSFHAALSRNGCVVPPASRQRIAVWSPKSSRWSVNSRAALAACCNCRRSFAPTMKRGWCSIMRLNHERKKRLRVRAAASAGNMRARAWLEYSK